MTRAEFLARIREESGDEERITGTASSGNTTTIVSAILNQADNHWKRLNAYIKTTTDTLAPQGESRRIASSSSSGTSVTVELPFFAAVGSGDTFGIAVFSNNRIINAAVDSLSEFSQYKPRRVTEAYNVSADQKRIAPTSATAQGFRPERIEFFSNTSKEQLIYRKDDYWWWDEHLNTIEWNWWWSENKALTLYGYADHTLPTLDSDALTLDAEDNGNVVMLAAINVLLSMSDKEMTDDFGELKPSSWRRGDVSMSFDGKSGAVEIKKSLLEQKENILKKYAVPVTLETAGVPSGKYIDRHQDPDGTPMPQVFWTLR
jgi:hypothetical protein